MKREIAQAMIFLLILGGAVGCSKTGGMKAVPSDKQIIEEMGKSKSNSTTKEDDDMIELKHLKYGKHQSEKAPSGNEIILRAERW